MPAAAGIGARKPLPFSDWTTQKLDHWENMVFVDDVPKIRAAVEAATQSGNFYVEFRVRYDDESVHWIAANGQIAADSSQPLLRGAIYEITARKALEVRLLALNETLEARVAELRQEARYLEILNDTGVAVAAERDLTTLVQTVTDAGVQLSHAEFGAFFYNVMREDGEAYTLYTLSGVPREAFAKFPMPRNTAIFEPTFRGRGPVRSDDILADPRYGKNAPYKGMPEGHLPVRSYLGGVGRLAVRRSSGWPFLRTLAASCLYRSGRTDRHRACSSGGRRDR